MAAAPYNSTTVPGSGNEKTGETMRKLEKNLIHD
jgi:hypothetical protein